MNQLNFWSKQLKRWISEQEVEIVLTGETQFEYLKSVAATSRVKQETEPTLVERWENEFKKLPEFYLQILSADITKYLTNEKQPSLF